MRSLFRILAAKRLGRRIGWLFGLYLLCGTGSITRMNAAEGGSLDLGAPTLVLPGEMSVPESVAAQMLLEEVERRSYPRW
jgi:hypothetical protein